MTISPAAASSREQARRADGRFGGQPRSESGVELGEPEPARDTPAAHHHRAVLAVAGMRGADPAETDRFIRQEARRYRERLAVLPHRTRPDPPDWFRHGILRAWLATPSETRDPALMYATYRAWCDPDVLPPTTLGVASIDLETANDADDFDPANGSIIEVGIVQAGWDGTWLGRYETLVRPSRTVADRVGTGIVSVHGITMDDVADSPRWDAVAGEVTVRLDGWTMLAHNTRFEQAWLGCHLPGGLPEGQSVSDSLTVAQVEMPHASNHRLATVCRHLGTGYTDGHRAMHDADAALRAVMVLRERAFERYRQDATFDGL